MNRSLKEVDTEVFNLIEEEHVRQRDGIELIASENFTSRAVMDCVHGDKSALSPSGIRIGTPAMTTRGCVESDFETIADFLDKCICISIRIQDECETRKLNEFMEKSKDYSKEINKIKEEVIEFSQKFEFYN